MTIYILGDNRQDFISDVKTSMMLDPYSFRILDANNITDAKNLYQQNNADYIILSETLLKNTNAEGLTDAQNVYGYSVTPNGDNYLSSIGVPSLGQCRTSQDLLEALCNNPLNVVNKVIPTPTPTPTPTATVISNNSNPNPNPNLTSQPEPQPQPQQERVQPQVQPNFNQQSTINEPVQSPPIQQPVQAPHPQPQPMFTPEMMAQFMQMMATMQGGQVPSTSQQVPTVNPINENTSNTQNTKSNSNGQSVGDYITQKKEDKINQQADEFIDNILTPTPPKTKVISVYAAKGGVGKTTISTELAVCLSLTSNGKRKLRTCIVDYNIDFGDVSTTLALDQGGTNLTYWASVIQELLDKGNSEDDITFTKEEIERYYLQRMPDTGLWALCAPITHADSTMVQTDTLKVMLRNLIENGEFDYIICDTGNNTRDSTIIALENSDYVFLVATQDVTTASCNATVLAALQNAGCIDDDKIRLIINNIMPSKDTGISVELVEETFPYPCICRIKRTPDIIKANNLKRPLVYKPNHEYTKQIQRLVKFVADDTVEEIEQPKKKGLFNFFNKYKS